MEIKHIAIKDIAVYRTDDGGLINPRGRVKNTSDLQESIRLVGQKTPIIVRQGEDDKYFIEDGHRRFTAIKALKQETIWAVVVENQDDVLTSMLASNNRQNLTPSQLGTAILKLAQDELMGIDKASLVCGVKPSYARLCIQLLDAPERVRKLVDKGEMSMSAYKKIANKPKAIQEKAAKLEKPTVENVQALSQSQDSEGVRTDLLDAMNAEHIAVSATRVLLQQIQKDIGTLTDQDKAYIHQLAIEIADFIEGVQDANDNQS